MIVRSAAFSRNPKKKSYIKLTIKIFYDFTFFFTKISPVPRFWASKNSPPHIRKAFCSYSCFGVYLSNSLAIPEKCFLCWRYFSLAESDLVFNSAWRHWWDPGGSAAHLSIIAWWASRELSLLSSSRAQKTDMLFRHSSEPVLNLSTSLFTICEWMNTSKLFLISFRDNSKLNSMKWLDSEEQIFSYTYI